MQRPQLLPYLQFVTVDESTLHIHGRRDEVWEVEGRSISDLAQLSRLLDGINTLEEAASLAGIGYPVAVEITNYLRQLRLIVDAPATSHRVDVALQNPSFRIQSHFLSRFGQAGDAMSNLVQAAVAIVGTAPWLHEIHQALCSIGVGSVSVCPSMPEVDLNQVDLLIACDIYEGPSIFNQADALCRNALVPWLRLSMSDTTLSLGPLFLPGETACYRCYEQRFLGNAPYPIHDVQLYKHQLTAGPGKSADCFAAFGQLAGGLVALAVMKFLSGCIPCELVGNEYTLNLLNLDAELHPLLKVPTCPVCVANKRPQQALVYRNREEED